MKWDSSFNLGLKKIDKQHQNVIIAINALETAVIKNQTGDMLDKVIIALDAYAYQHFDYEEKLLEKYLYPKLDVQLDEHSTFILKIKTFREDISKNENPRKLGMEICNFLRDWFISHILEKDKKYLEHLKSHGVQ